MNNREQKPKYYTYPEAAQLLRCSEKTLYNRVRNGEIQPLRNGRLVLFTDECIENFLRGGSGKKAVKKGAVGCQ